MFVVISYLRYLYFIEECRLLRFDDVWREERREKKLIIIKNNNNDETWSCTHTTVLFIKQCNMQRTNLLYTMMMTKNFYHTKLGNSYTAGIFKKTLKVEICCYFFLHQRSVVISYYFLIISIYHKDKNIFHKENQRKIKLIILE